MNTKQEPQSSHMPPRLTSPSWFAWLVIVVFAFLFFQGFSSAEISLERLVKGARNLSTFLGQAIPPDWSNMDVIANAMLETLYMAIVGVTVGIVLSVPFALLASRNTAPHPIVRTITRFMIATMRTIPDLIWALIFVVAVGLGPLAGILAIILDTIGFAARFFSERIEEVRPGPANALTASGAGRVSVIMGAILPETLASMSATSLYSVEKAIRSAVTLGLVGAGGIGVELSTAMRLFQFDKAFSIIIVVLLVVIGFEQLSSMIRKRVI
ncbi:phosphonate ABC transporter, permease protein PhnE [Marinobacter halophilus]|uniref:Phosphonate ABC transporter, permease protein PhnE n=1 Tax=Marinobacter halophilus TaxID=1323740 RepID=A0A2T1KF17_9GAMM|nr:phosphonate ABC transporter, permease protein PhnE [Marinobacter halophilus]PSF08721.1 phosphonate ABC transporter, permease protein PhnE [Marinobacter halophilus]GGC63225.1 phosphonate ABC transporter permease [Marinobacter halophilus]